MNKPNPVQEKSFAIAVRIVNAHRYYRNCPEVDYPLLKQLLRCGTSIGANVEEALGGHSKREFAAKLSVAYREAREADYWIRLLQETNQIEPAIAESLLSDCREIRNLLRSIIQSSRG